MYDIIVIGAGPAGLCAALYARRAEKSVLILEKDTFGGQITFSPKIENYPGIPEMSGNEFADKLVDQVLSQGAEIELGEAVAVESDGKTVTVTTADHEKYEAKSVIIATGARHRMLGVPGEKELVGHGISYCAVCDGAFYKNREVAVIGGGNSALQEAMLLSDTAKKVTLVQNLDTFTGEKRLLDTLAGRKNVEYITGTVVSGFDANGGELAALRLKNEKSGEETTLTVDGVFVAIGLEPCNTPFESVAALNDRGYFDTDESCKTNTPGVFVAGDCRSKSIRQITTAISDGSAASVAASAYIDTLTVS